MQLFVVGVVLFAALIHAAWNALLKTGSDTSLSTTLITTAAACYAGLALPFMAGPAAASWPYLAASLALQGAYYTLLIRAYGAGDMSHTYPLMRGAAPLIVAALSVPLVGESVPAGRWLGIALICGGVLGLALHRSQSKPHRAATGYALANAVAIASYTLVDGLGVRKSHAPLAYTLWLFLGIGIARLTWASLWRRRELLPYLRTGWRSGLAGGAGTVSSYALALWAMTIAPVALVAALRETSILFATVISALVLKERVSALRVACTGLIAAGAATLAALR